MMNLAKKILSPTHWKNYVYRKRIGALIWATNKKVRAQKADPFTIPVLIINYNRLKDLRNLVDSLLQRGHKNVVIIDNNSSYPPLLEYYEQIKNKVTVERMRTNHGHMVFWIDKYLFDKYANAYYIITDSDITLNPALPKDYLHTLIAILDKNKNVTKIGFALDIDSIPDTYTAKKEVLEWEERYWKNKIAADMYLADIDTTFAIYPPYELGMNNFYAAIRLAGNFTARHEGWYLDTNNLSQEDIYYFKRANDSNSWKLDNATGLLVDSSKYKNKAK